jgi:phage gpG-like protein
MAPAHSNLSATIRLGEIADGMGRMASPAFLHGLTREIGAEAMNRTLECFENSRDIYGRRWKPLVSREGKPLLDTARLRNSIHLRFLGDRFELVASAPGAAVHNFGGRISAKNAKYLKFRVGGAHPRRRGQWVQVKSVRIPKRQYMPDEKGRLPPAWSVAFINIARRRVRRTVGAR